MTVISLKVANKSEQHLEAFLQALEQSGKSRHTLINYRSDIRHFLGWFRVPLTGLTPHELRTYFQTLSHLNPASLARKQASLKRFFQWGLQNDILPRNPMDQVERIRYPDKLPRPLEDKVVHRILEKIPPHAVRDKLLFTLIRETGLRVSEALNIYYEDLWLTPDDEKIMIRSGKGGKSRMVMLYAAPTTLKLLKKHLANTGIQSGALFRGREAKGGSNKPMHYRSVHYLWEKYCCLAEVKAGIHALRHTFATELLNEGVNVTVVKKLLGHKNLQTTMRYTEVSDNYVKNELMRKHRRT
jgi:integrase/recombinase XerD